MCPPGFTITSAGTIIQTNPAAAQDSTDRPQMADPPSAEWIEKKRAASYNPPLGHAGVEPNKP
jgi:hypothetical protein